METRSIKIQDRICLRVKRLLALTLSTGLLLSPIPAPLWAMPTGYNPGSPSTDENQLPTPENQPTLEVQQDNLLGGEGESAAALLDNQATQAFEGEVIEPVDFSYLYEDQLAQIEEEMKKSILAAETEKEENPEEQPLEEDPEEIMDDILFIQPLSDELTTDDYESLYYVNTSDEPAEEFVVANNEAGGGRQPIRPPDGTIWMRASEFNRFGPPSVFYRERNTSVEFTMTRVEIIAVTNIDPRTGTPSSRTSLRIEGTREGGRQAVTAIRLDRNNVRHPSISADNNNEFERFLFQSGTRTNQLVGIQITPPDQNEPRQVTEISNIDWGRNGTIRSLILELEGGTQIWIRFVLAPPEGLQPAFPPRPRPVQTNTGDTSAGDVLTAGVQDGSGNTPILGEDIQGEEMQFVNEEDDPEAAQTELSLEPVSEGSSSLPIEAVQTGEQISGVQTGDQTESLPGSGGNVAGIPVGPITDLIAQQISGQTPATPISPIAQRVLNIRNQIRTDAVDNGGTPYRVDEGIVRNTVLDPVLRHEQAVTLEIRDAGTNDLVNSGEVVLAEGKLRDVITWTIRGNVPILLTDSLHNFGARVTTEGLTTTVTYSYEVSLGWGFQKKEGDRVLSPRTSLPLALLGYQDVYVDSSSGREYAAQNAARSYTGPMRRVLFPVGNRDIVATMTVGQNTYRTSDGPFYIFIRNGSYELWQLRNRQFARIALFNVPVPAVTASLEPDPTDSPNPGIVVASLDESINGDGVNVADLFTDDTGTDTSTLSAEEDTEFAQTELNLEPVSPFNVADLFTDLGGSGFVGLADLVGDLAGNISNLSQAEVLEDAAIIPNTTADVAQAPVPSTAVVPFNINTSAFYRETAGSRSEESTSGLASRDMSPAEPSRMEAVGDESFAEISNPSFAFQMTQPLETSLPKILEVGDVGLIEDDLLRERPELAAMLMVLLRENPLLFSDLELRQLLFNLNTEGAGRADLKAASYETQNHPISTQIGSLAIAPPQNEIATLTGQMTRS